MKKGLIITLLMLVAAFGVILIIQGHEWPGIIIGAIAIYLINNILKGLKSNGKLVFYNPHTTQNRMAIGSGVQLLETLHIISNTKNVETLTSRVDYLKGLYSRVFRASTVEAYPQNADEAIKEYRKKYHDRRPTTQHLELLKSPNLQNLYLFLDNEFYNCAARIYAHKVKEASNLKTNKAKERRAKQFDESVIKILALYNDLPIESNYKDDIGKLQDTIQEAIV